MLKPILYVLVGMPGSGKSTYAESLGCEVYSSDSLRLELFGDINDQEHNNEVFKELHRRIRDSIARERNCVYDATNVSEKRRTAFLKSLKKLYCEKVCLFFATDFDLCVERDSKRERSVGYNVIKRMYLSTSIPQYREGWDRIEIITTLHPNKEYNVYKYIQELSEVPHDNPHHALSLGDHMYEVCRYVSFNSAIPLGRDMEGYHMLCMAALCHDIGKEFTKTYKKFDNTEDNVAHYYGHEYVSAYMYLLYCNEFPTEEKLFVADLIQNHMKFFSIPGIRENIEKEKGALKKKLGNRKYYMLEMLHEADIMCS